MLASHNHSIDFGTLRSDASGNFAPVTSFHVGSAGWNTSSVGSNGNHNHTFSGSSSHTHNITLNLKYINVIVCSKV